MLSREIGHVLGAAEEPSDLTSSAPRGKKNAIPLPTIHESPCILMGTLSEHQPTCSRLSSDTRSGAL